MKIRNSEQLIEIQAPAKVNFFLELLKRRQDGFHELETVISSVSIFDTLYMSARGDAQIQLSVDPGREDGIPTGSENLIVRSLNRLQAEAGQVTGMNILLRKRIPPKSGLGGASSDAAAALIGANRIWNLNWSVERLSRIAAELGSDVAFFLKGGTALCTGRGERVRNILAPAGLPIVIAKPDDGLSTAEVYSKCRVSNAQRTTHQLLSAISKGSPVEIGRHLWNRLEKFAAGMTQSIVRLNREFSQTTCLGHQLSGSGSSYFGIFSSHRVAKIEAKRLSNRMPDVRIFCSQTLNRCRFSRYRFGFNRSPQPG